MNAANALIRSTTTTAIPRIRPNPARLRKPSPLPLRPLVPNRFKPPRGEKQVFLPNFTLALLRTPTQPPHFASFITPLWLNKLDLKDYLYNLYGVQVLHVRSYIIQGKVVRNDRTRRLSRKSAQKKMTVEMVQGREGQGPFVWPEEPLDLSPWDKEATDARDEQREEQRKRQMPDERHKLDPPDAESLRERARAFLKGKARWRPSWEENGGAAAVAMGREGRGGG